MVDTLTGIPLLAAAVLLVITQGRTYIQDTLDANGHTLV
jgi:hypothetical protein